MKFTPELISKNPRFTKKEQQFIFKCLLTKINLTIRRGKVVNIGIRKFGTIHTHRNRKKIGKLNYQKRQNKKYWVKYQEDRLKDDNYLLFG